MILVPGEKKTSSRSDPKHVETPSREWSVSFPFFKWCGDCDDDDDHVGTEDEGGYCVEDYYDHYNYDQEIYKVEVDDHSTRPLANGAVSKASWPTQILARCQILNKGTWHYSDDWAILKFFPMTDPMIDPMTGPKAGSLKKKFWILKNASILCVTYMYWYKDMF